MDGGGDRTPSKHVALLASPKIVDTRNMPGELRRFGGKPTDILLSQMWQVVRTKSLIALNGIQYLTFHGSSCLLPGETLSTFSLLTRRHAHNLPIMAVHL